MRSLYALPLAAALVLSCKPELGVTLDSEPDAGVEDLAEPQPDLAMVVKPPTIPGCIGDCVVNTKCSQESGPTTLTGVVTIPAGTLPVYNAKVYIPTGGAIPLPQPSGAYCDRCDQVPRLYSTSTDINGRFTLTNVPSGLNIPLIVRVGKWRRLVTVPKVLPCAVTEIDPAETRLPRNQTEGNIPRIALSTGSADALECILRSNKLGLDDSEFTPESGSGRVNLYAGANGAAYYVPTLNGGARFTASVPQPELSWWDTYDNLAKYDIILLSCEGAQYMNYKSPTALQNLEKYISKGGRVFASHWHNGWMAGAQPPQKIQTVAAFNVNLAIGNITALIDTSFPKGNALADWMILPEVVGGGTASPRGQVYVAAAKNTISSLDSKLAQRWVSTSSNIPQYFSFEAPIGAAPADQCGQMVFTDLHVSAGTGGDVSSAATPFPNGCKAAQLSAQEKALIFMLFDLTNCLQPPIG